MTDKTAQEGTFLKPRHMPVPDIHGSPNTGSCKSVNRILALIGDKWSVLIIMILGAGPRRFNELKRMIDGISQRMLTLTLRSLEREGFVTRTVFPTIPPRVDYELTALGHSLSEPVKGLGAWAFAHQETIETARRDFDMSNGKINGIMTRGIR